MAGQTFTFQQRARLLFTAMKQNVAAATQHQGWRRYGSTFIMSCAVFGALASKEGHKADWDRMNADTSLYVGPWAANSNKQPSNDGRRQQREQ